MDTEHRLHKRSDAEDTVLEREGPTVSEPSLISMKRLLNGTAAERETRRYELQQRHKEFAAMTVIHAFGLAHIIHGNVTRRFIVRPTYRAVV